MYEKKQQNAAAECWAALMVGDALGAPAEFLYEYEIRKRYPNGIREMVPGFGIMTDRRPGEVTDDTQMAVCLHRALVRADGWDAAIAKEEYLRWLATDPPDVGETVKAGLEGRPILESQGNGALMRTMPIALWAHSHPGFDWETAAREDAALTHPHPVCADCNALYVYTLLQALRPRATRQGVYDSALAWAVQRQLHLTVISTLLAAATTPPDYDDNGGERIGWVLIALHCAFYHLLHAPNPAEALVTIVSAGGDTDTNAAITAPLLAAIEGIDSLPPEWLHCVRQANPQYAYLLPG